MTRHRGTLMAAAVVPLIALAACAQPGSTPVDAADSSAASSAPSSPAADDLVVRTESFGGFVPADRTYGRIPDVSVYGDGRVITQGPVPAIYPGPALPNLQVQMIAPEMVRELVRQGVAAGVKNGAEYGQPGVADAPSTRVTVVSDGVKQVVEVNALGQAQPSDPRLTGAQQKARATLAAYVEKLTGLQSAEGMPKPAKYAPVAIAALARPYQAPSAGLPAGTAQAWPGPALPGSTSINPSLKVTCVVATGADKDKVLAAAGSANAGTQWTDGGQKWTVTFRPLLPDETDCAALTSK